MVNVDPERLHAYHLSPDDVVTALNNGNLVMPSGNLRVQDQMPIVPSNAQVRDPKELGNLMVKPDPAHNAYLRDLATIEDTQDTPTGYALVNGKRTVFILVTKRADASTLTVVNASRGPCRECRTRCRKTYICATSLTNRPTSPAPCGASAARVCSEPH